MKLQEYNNKNISITDIDNQVFSGICLYENKEDFETEYDVLSIRTSNGWVKIYENEIKNRVAKKCIYG